MILKKEEMTKAIKELKDEVNSLLQNDAPKEQIDAIAKVSQNIEAFEDKINAVYDENSSLKEDLIRYIRIGGDNKPPTNDTGGEVKTLEQCLKEIQDNRKK